MKVECFEHRLDLLPRRRDLRPRDQLAARALLARALLVARKKLQDLSRHQRGVVEAFIAKTAGFIARAEARAERVRRRDVVSVQDLSGLPDGEGSADLDPRIIAPGVIDGNNFGRNGEDILVEREEEDEEREWRASARLALAAIDPADRVFVEAEAPRRADARPKPPALRQELKRCRQRVQRRLAEYGIVGPTRASRLRTPRSRPRTTVASDDKAPPVAEDCVEPAHGAPQRRSGSSRR